MAITRIHGLTPLTAPADGDFVEIADTDARGHRKIALSDLATYFGAEASAYGGLYYTGASEQTLADGVAELLTESSGVMPSQSTTPATASDSITIGTAGVYEVTGQFSYTGANLIVYKFEVRVDDVATEIACTRKLGTGADVGSCSFAGIITLAADEVVTVWVTGTGTTPTITLANAQLTVQQV